MNREARAFKINLSESAPGKTSDRDTEPRADGLEEVVCTLERFNTGDPNQGITVTDKMEKPVRPEIKRPRRGLCDIRHPGAALAEYLDRSQVLAQRFEGQALPGAEERIISHGNQLFP